MEKIKEEEKKGADKVVEFFDAWMKSQKEFMESWVKTQKEFMDNWIAATRKMQDSFLSIGGPQEGAMRETLSLYKSWLTTMVNSSKVFTDEAGRIQDTWKNTVEKQMDMSREVVKNISDLFKKAA